MFSSEEDDKIESRYFYSRTEQKVVQESHLPEIAGHRLVGSSQGYLLSVDHDVNLVATNPLCLLDGRTGGSRVLLPPASALPDAKYNNYMTAKEKRNELYQRAVLSPGARAAVIMHQSGIMSPDPGGREAVRRYQTSLAFARPGDRNWTALKCSEAADMIFHKGHLHTISDRGAISVYDLDRPSDPPFTSSPLPHDKYGRTTKYLVESPRGEDLFLLSEIRKSTTKYFEVYLLDKTTYTWKPKEDLKNLALFVGFNNSMSLYAIPVIRRNCIYFAQYNGKGIYSLKHGDVKPIYSSNDLDQFDQPRPMWLTPSL